LFSRSIFLDLYLPLTGAVFLVLAHRLMGMKFFAAASAVLSVRLLSTNHRFLLVVDV
jgi:hypothetical protein